MSVLPDARGEGGFASPRGEVPPVRRALIFTIVALALIMSSVDATIVATALNSLQQGLQTSINWAGWTLTAYSLGLVLWLPVSGKLCERYGRRNVFLGSVVAFTAASLGCGLAENIFVLTHYARYRRPEGLALPPRRPGSSWIISVKSEIARSVCSAVCFRSVR
jgi:MFS family permease